MEKKFKLDLEKAKYTNGEIQMNGTVYTKNKKVENVTLIMEYHKIEEWMRKNKIKEKEYINKITD